MRPGEELGRAAWLWAHSRQEGACKSAVGGLQLVRLPWDRAEG